MKLKKLEIILQSQVSESHKTAIRKYDIDGPFRSRVVVIDCDIDTGPGSGANAFVADTVRRTLKKCWKNERYFYARATFESGTNARPTYSLRTIIPRQEIPKALRSIRY